MFLPGAAGRLQGIWIVPMLGSQVMRLSGIGGYLVCEFWVIHRNGLS